MADPPVPDTASHHSLWSRSLDMPRRARKPAHSTSLSLILGESEPGTPPPPLDAVAAQLFDITVTSNVLSTMAKVRKLTIQQALVHASSPDKALQIALESLVTAPCMPLDLRDTVTDLLLTKSWGELRHVLQCPPIRCDQDGWPLISIPSRNAQTHFQHFRSMVVAIFTRSRKMAGMPPERRRQVGRILHQASSISEIGDITTKSLETSVAFHGAERDDVANDMLDFRWDLLLGPDRFDCDETPRLAAHTPVSPLLASHASPLRWPAHTEEASEVLELELVAEECIEEVDDCPVCLGEREVDTQLPCGHKLCNIDASEWLAQNATCPLCRAPANFSDCRPCDGQVAISDGQITNTNLSGHGSSASVPTGYIDVTQYGCDGKCGFTGSYDVVLAHEATCPAARQAL